MRLEAQELLDLIDAVSIAAEDLVYRATDDVFADDYTDEDRAEMGDKADRLNRLGARLPVEYNAQETDEHPRDERGREMLAEYDFRYNAGEDPNDPDGAFTIAADIMADLLHALEALGRPDPEHALELAAAHYIDEREGR